MLLILISAFGQLERDTLIVRTKIGLAAARRRGRVGGRPRKRTDTQIEGAKAVFKDGTPATDIASACGISVPTQYQTLPASKR